MGEVTDLRERDQGGPETAEDARPAGRCPPAQAESGRFPATVVSGQVVLPNNEHTGALPGQLLRGPLARA